MTAKASACGLRSTEVPAQATYGEVNLKAKKLTSLTPISNVLRYNAVGIDGLVADDLMRNAKLLRRRILNGEGTAHTPLS